MAETIWFKIDRYFDIQDLAEKGIRIFIQWYVDDSIKGFSESHYRDITSESGKIIFEWPIDNSITAQAGVVYFSVVFFKKKNDREYEYMLNTLPAQMTISKGLDIDENILTAEPVDYMNNYLQSLVDSTKSVGSGVADTIAFLSGIKNNKNPYITGDRIYALAYNDTQNNIESTSIIYEWVRTDNGAPHLISEAQKYEYKKLTGEDSIFASNMTYNNKLSYYKLNGTDYDNVSGVLDASKFSEEKDSLYLKVAYCEIAEKGTYTVSAYGKTVNDKSEAINNTELSVSVTGLPDDLTFSYIPSPDANDGTAYYYGNKIIQLKPNIESGINFTYKWYKDNQILENATNSITLGAEEGVYKPVVTAEKNKDSKDYNNIYSFIHCLDISGININVNYTIADGNYEFTINNNKSELGSVGNIVIKFFDNTSKNIYSSPATPITNTTITVPTGNIADAVDYMVTITKGTKTKSTEKIHLG